MADPWVVFPGNLQGRHARETGPKGCCLVSVEDGRVESVEHRVVDVVRWASCKVDLGKVNSMQGVLDNASKAMRDVLDDAEDRIVATRIRFVGASPVHTELQGKTQWLRHKLLELAAEQFGEGLWIEKVVMATTSKLDRGAVLAGDGALGGLARSIQEVRDEPSAVRGLDAVMAAFREKLPAEVFLAEDGLRLDDQEVMAKLIQEAKELLLGKLMETGGDL